MKQIVKTVNGEGSVAGWLFKVIDSSGAEIDGSPFTSDENGIRHGGEDFKDASSEDAYFMLISCSAFINYLKVKYSKIK